MSHSVSACSFHTDEMILLGLLFTVIRFSAVLPFSAPVHHLPAHLPAPAPQAGRGDCLDAHRACGSDPRCEALYRGVELCADDAGAAPLGEQAASECLESQDALLARHPPLLACRCQRGSRREERCLHVYWSVRLLPGEDEMEVSPYELMPMDTHMASLIVASSSLPQDGLNPCLKAAQDCGLFEKCGALRSEYVLACTKRPSGTDRCNRQKCHRALRRFLERVPEEYSLGVLFCPCGEPLCGERRRKTIVPSCSYLERDGPPPNCLHLQSYCRRDDLCRSRLADFLHSCQASSMSSSGCVRDTSAGLCLRAYAGLIGTMMTPNYVSNSSADVALWCNCEGSGNQWQDCLRLQRMFTHNPCLSSSISALGLPGPQTVENTPPPPSRSPPFNPGDELLSNNLLPEHNNIVLGSEEDDEFLRKEQGEPGEGGQFDVIPLYSERATAPSLGPRGAATTGTTPPLQWVLLVFSALHLSWG
ncbi:GDNF family receptor alpha-3 [Gadus morhua]|nr:GDNF family receptor alpha-4-like [Gadus morhua]